MTHRPFLTASICALLVACSGAEIDLSAELEEANRCKVAEDCVLIGSTCPFGCYIYVHADEADRLRAAVDAYESTCIYSCIQSFGVECVANRCEAIVDQPMAAPDADTALLLKIREQTPDIPWGDVSSFTNPDTVWVDADTSFPEHSLRGLRMTAPTQNLADYRSDLEEMLRSEGWFVHQPIADADGPQGSVWGYPKYDGEELVQLIIFSWHADCVRSEQEEESTCDNPRSEVFLSDVMPF